MKKERYFRDELRKLFIGYAIVPSVLFTLVCGLVFLAALIQGKMSGNGQHNRYVTGEINRALTAYEDELEIMAEQPELFAGEIDTDRQVRIFQDFYNVSNELGYEADLFVLDANRNRVLSTRAVLPGYLQIRPGVDWGIFASMDQRPRDTAIRLMDGWKKQDRDIAMGRSILNGDETVGYLVFAINSSQFQPVLDQADTQILITDRFGRVYLSNTYSFTDNSNRVTEELEGAGRYLRCDKNIYLTGCQETYHRMFRVYSVSDIQNIVVSLGMGGALIITALALMTIWVSFSTKRVTEKKTRDFYRILDVMEGARDGNLDLIHIDSDNEFKTIADAYNEMITSLKLQMENNRKMTELVAASQIKQLESQFNPHFLYNTLENIRYMCRIEPEIAAKMVFSLSSLLRYSLDGSREEVTLREDLDHLENYLTILKYRFNRRFSYGIDVEPETLACRIPKLVLQPMIENSVKYGFGNQEKLRVELKVYIHDGKLMMICRDDGIGMTPQTLSELTALLGQKENRSRHSGLYNIHRRIEILYGRPYGVEIRSTEGHGTTLIITLPANTEEKEC
ncbi:MAG: histidine kinase [Enterocloster asparagiformis]|nr:histidine kinase [Enterocloster asparagiformis]